MRSEKLAHPRSDQAPRNSASNTPLRNARSACAFVAASVTILRPYARTGSATCDATLNTVVAMTVHGWSRTTTLTMVAKPRTRLGIGEPLRLEVEHARVAPSEREEFVVAALFDDRAMLQDHDVIGAAHGREPM